MDNAKIDVSRAWPLPMPELQPVNIGRVVKLDPPLLCEQSTVKVTLKTKQDCLLNMIELEGFPNQPLDRCLPAIAEDEVPMLSTQSSQLITYMADSSFQNERFSYIIRVSKNGKDWIELFNYSMYSCHSIQKLYFPTLAFRWEVIIRLLLAMKSKKADDYWTASESFYLSC